MFKIDKNIDMPALERRGRKSLYPFAEMEKGDSFFVEGKLPGQMASVAYNWSKRHSPEAKFVIKKEGLGCRVWRFE